MGRNNLNLWSVNAAALFIWVSVCCHWCVCVCPVNDAFSYIYSPPSGDDQQLRPWRTNWSPQGSPACLATGPRQSSAIIQSFSYSSPACSSQRLVGVHIENQLESVELAPPWRSTGTCPKADDPRRQVLRRGNTTFIQEFSNLIV